MQYFLSVSQFCAASPRFLRCILYRRAEGRSVGSIKLSYEVFWKTKGHDLASVFLLRMHEGLTLGFPINIDPGAHEPCLCRIPFVPALQVAQRLCRFVLFTVQCCLYSPIAFGMLVNFWKCSQWPQSAVRDFPTYHNSVYE